MKNIDFNEPIEYPKRSSTSNMMQNDLYAPSDTSHLSIRDVWQVEGSLDITPLGAHEGDQKQSGAKITQEFFLFIPASLHVTNHTYSKEDFYQDRTNLLRFKTPQITLEELLSHGNSSSPFTRIEELLGIPQNEEIEKSINNELKLLANIVRSQFRDQMEELLHNGKHVNDAVLKLIESLKQVRLRLSQLEQEIEAREFPARVLEHIHHVEEFISRSVQKIALHSYLQFLDKGMKISALEELAISEKRMRVEEYGEPKDYASLNEEQKEEVLYRDGLLNKFALSALLLSTKRSSFVQKYGQLTASIAAGVAMSIYLGFFFWRGAFLIDSLWLLLLTTLVYVLKDRVKDTLKNLLQQHAGEWFDDFETEIIGPDGQKLGFIGEHFHLLDPARLPEEIIRIRNQGPESLLAKVLRPETVLYYKKRIQLHIPKTGVLERRFDFHHLYRLNLSEFLKKASNAFEPSLLINPDDGSITCEELPKVYHINLIIRTTWQRRESSDLLLERFRLVVNRDGIMRIESIT